MTVTLACVGDLHGRLDRLERVADWLRDRAPDVVLLTGDFGRAPRGDRPVHEAAVASLERLGVPILLVPGNHDRPELDHPASVDRRVAEARPEGALVCGHIHEAAGAEVVDGCLCYNAGSLGAFAGRVQAGLLRREAAGGRWRVVHHDLAADTSWRVTTGA